MKLGIAWNERLLYLPDFKQQWGDCGVPQKYTKSPNIGLWVIHQRSQYTLLNNRRVSFKKDDRIAKLEKLGFQSSSDSQLSCTIAWNERLFYLLEIKQQRGHFHVPQHMIRTRSLGLVNTP